MRLIVTRPAAQAAAWVDGLRTLGAEAEALPLIEIAPPADPAPVHAAWRRLRELHTVMFVSANAVQQWFALAPEAADWPAGVRAAATGPGTAAALRDAGVPTASIDQPATEARQFDSEALWQRLAGQDWRGRRVLVVRGEDGRDWLADQWQSRGARLEFVAAYRRRLPQPDDAQRALLQQVLAAPSANAWVFSSSQAIDHLQAWVPGHDWSAAVALASHPRIAAAARGAGFGRVAQVAGTPAALAEWAENDPSIQSGAL